MSSSNRLFLNAFTLDSETLSLNRGAPITEIGVYDWNKKEVVEYLLKPRAVFIEGSTSQDITKLASSVMDKHTAHKFKDWPEALRTLVSLEIKRDISQLQTDDQLKQAIAQTNDFLYRNLYGSDGAVYPYLLGQQESEAQKIARSARFAQEGVRFRPSTGPVDIETLLKPGALFDIHKATQGTTLWIANANFDSKMLGAQLGAMGAEAVTAFKRQMETSSEYADPFYVTGKEVNQARAAAQLTGDWTGVWKAYNANVPKVGEVAVRDQLDLIRSLHSYGKKLGLMADTPENRGISVDLQYRLFGSAESNPAEALRRLTDAEAHRAAEDPAIYQRYVGEKSAEYNQVLQDVYEKTPQGQRYLKEAEAGTGKLVEIGKYFQNTELVTPTTSRKALLQRLERAQIDIFKEGKSWQFSGYESVHQMPQVDPSGREVKIARPRPGREGYSSMDEVVQRLASAGEYGQVDVAAEWDAMKAHLSAAGKGADKTQVLKSYVAQQNQDVVETFFKTNAQAMIENSPAGALRKTASIYGNRQAKNLAEDFVRAAPALGRAAGFGALAIAGMGALWGLRTDSSPQRNAGSILTMNYDEWSASHPEGLAPQGMAHQYRSANTDFGSPYQGMDTSAGILMDQKLLAAREQWSRQQYWNNTFDQETGLFGDFGVFSYARRDSYTSNNSGRALGANEMPGLRNRKGMRVIDVNPNDWKLSVEDADTVTLKRRGVRSSVARFFGLDSQDYTFRLEGIDSTETSHGSDSYHSPQPFASQAKTALAALYEGKNLQIAFDPTNMTYGRNVGVVYGDGKNLNLEEVKRGIAAHLPYGKRDKAHVNWDSFSYAQEKAVASSRGMWATPWAQTYNAFTEAAGTQITFDTFTKPSKMAKNYGTMSILTEMEHAQSMGVANEDILARAASIGKSWDMRGDNVRPFVTQGRAQSHHSSYMSQLLTDNSRFITTQGTNNDPYRTSHKGGSGTLNGYLALDTMGGNSSPWSRRTLDAYDRYGAEQTSSRRRQSMAAMQRQVNQQFGVSPIGHNRM